MQLLNIARRNWQTMGMLNIGMPHLGRLTRPEQRFLKRTFPANVVDVAHFEAAVRAGSIDPRIVRIQERARAVVNPPVDDLGAAAVDAAAGPNGAAPVDTGAAGASEATAVAATALTATVSADTAPAAAAAAAGSAPVVPGSPAALPVEGQLAAGVAPDDDLRAASEALTGRLYHFLSAQRLFPWARSRHFGRFRKSNLGEGIKDETCIIAPAMLKFIEQEVVRCMAGLGTVKMSCGAACTHHLFAELL